MQVTPKSSKRFSLRLILTSVVLAVGLALPAVAQDEGAAHVVTYIEVAPSATEQAAELIAAYAEASRRVDGSGRFQALQRIGRSSHFAILETWRSVAAQEAHAGSAPAARFRDDLVPLLYSPADARPHRDLITAASDDVGPDGVFVVTHVDVIPSNTDLAVELLQTLASASRGEDGSVRFDVLVQSNRGNHMTVVEAWESPESREEHYGAAHTKTFRGSLFPLSGALYDERLYRAL
jgi:quinol monooxygenase YgiN